MISRLLLVLTLACPLWAAAQDAFTNRSTELKDRGDGEARALATLPENTAVRVLARGGAWTRVEAGGQSGWVRVFHLRFAAIAEGASSGSSGGGVLSTIGAAMTGQRAPKSANLATTGVRGLSQEELRNANPDAEALRRMQSFRADNAAAERFAREGKLAAVEVRNPDEAPAPSKGSRR